MTLTDFLLARIAEDEQWVTGHVASHGCEVYDAFATSPADCGEMTVGFKRWLAECESKRLVVEWSAMEPRDDQVLYFLALPYADHPDYREEWRP